MKKVYRARFIINEPKKATDSKMSDLDVERQTVAEQVSQWQEKLKKLKAKNASTSDIKKAEEKLSFYENKFNELDPKAEDMALSSDPKWELEPRTMTEVVMLLKKYLKRNIPVMLLGSSGFGKTSILKQAATDIPGFPVKAENVLDIRAGMMNVEDLKGLPMLVKNSDDPEKAFTQTTIPSWLKKVLLSKENFVLFFDELNHASAPVLNALYGIILERQLDEFYFGDRTRIVAAGNTFDENDDLTELSTPLRNRLEIINIDSAVKNDSTYFENYLIKKYEGRIPKELLDIVFDKSIKTSNARAVDFMLEAWALDIEEGDELLTKTGAIDSAHYLQAQKVYSKMNTKATGSQKHAELINQIEIYINKLLTDRRGELGASSKVYTVKDLLKGNVEPVMGIGTSFTLPDSIIKEIKNNFKDVPEELVSAAISKIIG